MTTQDFNHLISLQLKLEEEMVESGSEKFFRDEAKDLSRGNAASTSGARYVIRALIAPLEAAIKAFMAEAKNGKPGRKNQSLPLFAGHNPATLAFLTLKEGINAATCKEAISVQSAARLVARAVTNEVNLRFMLKTNPKMFTIILKEAQAHPSSAMRDKIAAALVRKTIGKELSATEETLFGCKLIDLAMISTGIFDVFTKISGPSHKPQTCLALTAEAVKRISDTRDIFSTLSPVHLPFIVPPRPWTSPKKGASWSGAFHRMHLVRARDREITKMLAEHDLSSVYEAVNAVQETAWKVNSRVLEVLVEAFDTERQIAGLPERAPEAPPFPAEAVLASEALSKLRNGRRRINEKLILETLLTPEELASRKSLREWKKAAAISHTNRRKNTAQRMVIRRTMDVATRFAEYEAIYFPHSLDFRGRLYPFCNALSPQGADFTKGLLTFAHGKPIGKTTGPGWLAIHGANTYGADKITLEARVEWTEAHTEIIKAVAADPWSSPGLEFWSAADKPWQFLAFCFEWGDYQAQGEAFVSRLPVAMDGSCNGLQHYSAALRDKAGGASVNLVPGPKPADIYATVAARTLEKVLAFISPNSSNIGTIDDLENLKSFWIKHEIDAEDTARKWVAFGIDRKITKRSVMTLPYGSTRFSCRLFIEEAILDKMAKGKENPWKRETDLYDESLFKASLWLQPLVWQSITETVRAARDGMEWLQSCANVVSSHGLPLVWTLPDGFVVRQANRSYKTDRVETILGGRIIKLSVRHDESAAPIDKRLQSQGVAPNWVHSMDAAALRSYVRTAKDNGITSFALVHDSYGALAADLDVMLTCLKESFIDLYEAQDPLATFRMDMIEALPEGKMDTLPALPPRGDLDLSGLRQSDFFFS